MRLRLTIGGCSLDGAGRAGRGLRPDAGARAAGRGAGPSAEPSRREERAPSSEIEVSAPAPMPGRHRRHRHARPAISSARRRRSISVLSSEDIARTGEGDIAGALQRVTGLSVVGNGFVFVRGLGDRYSLALLNGSPLPSPEPLRRVVPLDIFPTSVIASLARPEELFGQLSRRVRRRRDQPHHARRCRARAFLDVGASVTGDAETTVQPRLFLLRQRPRPARLRRRHPRLPGRAARRRRRRHLQRGTTAAERRDFAASLVNAPTTLLQRDGRHPGQCLGRRSAAAPRPRSAAAGSASSPRPATATAWRIARRAPADLARPRPRRHAADQLPARSPPTTGSSSTACSASAPSSASTASAGPISSSATR